MIDCVTICALTYRRPEGLACLLAGLSALRFSNFAPRITIVIVDNDPAGSGRSVCQEFHGRPWEIRYSIEPRPGLSAARNTALRSAMEAKAVWIALLDDDECPEPDWLEQLLTAQRTFSADAVGGAVTPVLPAESPEWVRQGRFLEYLRRPTGTRMPYLFTNNVLMRASILASVSPWFDERYNFTGGEDRQFFSRVGVAGFRMVWCDEAIVRESLPANRATARWILQREFRYGNTQSRVELDLRPGIRTRAGLLALAGYRAIKGAATTLAGSFRRRDDFVRGLTHLFYCGGVLFGWIGGRYAEYQRSDVNSHNSPC